MTLRNEPQATAQHQLKIHQVMANSMSDVRIVPFSNGEERRVRVCHLQLLPIMSGVQRSMLEIIRHLDKARYDVSVACQGRGPLTERLDELGFRCHLVPALHRPISPFRDMSAYRQLRNLFRAEKIDLVHTHSSKPGILGRLAAAHVSVPYVVHHVHGLPFHEYSSALQRLLYTQIERWAGRHSDRVIFVNNEERELCLRTGLLPAEKCITIPNGVCLTRFSASAQSSDRERFRQKHAIDEGETIILFTSRVCPQKQPMILPRIVAHLRELSPSGNWRLVVQGSGELESKLIDAVRRSGLCDQFLFLGWQANPTQAINAADIVLLPSKWEGLPICLLEAQAAGLPVVASNVKGNREVVTPATGFLVTANSAEEYACALRVLISHPETRMQMGIEARRRARLHFDTKINSRLVADLYEALFCNYQNASTRPIAA